MRRLLSAKILMATSGLILLGSLRGDQIKRTSDSLDAAFVEPLVGHVFDSGVGQIRTILGIPGAARVAAPIPVDFTMDNAIDGNRGAFWIASQTDGASALFLRPLDPSQTPAAISGSMAHITAGAFSLTGQSAILYGSDCNCIQIVSGFPDSVNVTRTIDTTSLPGTVTALAVNDDASLAAVSMMSVTDDSQSAQVLLFDLSGDNAPRLIMASGASGLGFSPNGKDLAIVDAASHSLLIAQDVLSGAGPTNFAGEGEGLAMPVAVAYVNDSRMLVADRAGQVHVVDLESRQLQSIPCSCKPSTIDTMALKSTYRLTGTDTGAVWILTLTDSDARVRFIPVETDDSQGTESEIPQ